MTLNDLLRGEAATGYRLGRRRHPPRRHAAESGEPLPLLDDREAGLRAYLVRCPDAARSSPTSATRGWSSSPSPAVSLQVLLETGRPVLRTGEAIMLDQTPIAGWRNLGLGEAMLFWIRRDA